MLSNLDPGWLAVAQVYATLAIAAVQRTESGYQGHFGPSREAVAESHRLQSKAETALRAAGVEG